jgi:hypothetical protein
MLKLDKRADLDALNSGQIKESLTLEYKSSGAVDRDQKRKEEMAKDALAFANAAGGQIVYGITERDNLPQGLDAGIDPLQYPGIWFEQVIQQNRPLLGHGADRLPSVDVESYNVELEDDEGFIGDRASNTAFRKLLGEWRKAVRKGDEDPFGDKASQDISKRKLEASLAEGDTEAAGIIQGAIEDFAQEFARVIRRFFKLKAWRDCERIAVGGGSAAAGWVSWRSDAPR